MAHLFKTISRTASMVYEHHMYKNIWHLMGHQATQMMVLRILLITSYLITGLKYFKIDITTTNDDFLTDF